MNIPDSLRWLAEQSERPDRMPCGELTGKFLIEAASRFERIIVSRPEAHAGEVGELIKELRHIRRDGSWHEKDSGDNVHPVCARTADLIERLAPRDGGEDEVELVKAVLDREGLVDPDFVDAHRIAAAIVATLDRGKVRDGALEEAAVIAEGWKSCLRPGTEARLLGHQEAARDIAKAIRARREGGAR